MEFYTNLYLDMASKCRLEAATAKDERVREASLKLAEAYEMAAETFRRYPEAA